MWLWLWLTWAVVVDVGGCGGRGRWTWVAGMYGRCGRGQCVVVVDVGGCGGRGRCVVVVVVDVGDAWLWLTWAVAMDVGGCGRRLAQHSYFLYSQWKKNSISGREKINKTALKRNTTGPKPHMCIRIQVKETKINTKKWQQGGQLVS